MIVYLKEMCDATTCRSSRNAAHWKKKSGNDYKCVLFSVLMQYLISITKH